METKERRAHFIRLEGINYKMGSLGITFGITLMEDQDNFGSYSIRAWWQDESSEDYPSQYTKKDQVFEDVSLMSQAITWLYSTLTDHITARLEDEADKGKRAEKFLAEINSPSALNGFVL